MSTPYRLEVVYDEAEVTPNPERLSCDDCRWFGGNEHLGGMAQKSCYVWSTSPWRPGDHTLATIRVDDYVKWTELRARWNFNDDGDCFTFAHRNFWVRLWKRISG